MKPKQIMTMGILMSVLSAGCMDTSPIENYDFDLWCGDELCGWRLYEDKDGNRYGSVEEAATWHEKDKGVELKNDEGGRDAILYQTLQDRSGVCKVFSVQANVEKGAKLWIEFDYLADDPLAPERSVEIEGDDWNTTNVEAPMPETTMDINLIFRKSGRGKVVLSRVTMEDATACNAEMPAVEFPDGAPCEENSECRSGLCERQPSTSGVSTLRSCSACNLDTPCDDDQSCGYDFSEDYRTMYQGCGEVGRHVLGQRCQWDDECTTGICCAGKCATCCQDTDCPEEQQCQHLGSDKPDQCAPEAGLGEAGDFCLSDFDCQSGTCEAEAVLRTCNVDGRPCTADSECINNDETGACTEVGYYDGVCRQ